MIFFLFFFSFVCIVLLCVVEVETEMIAAIIDAMQSWFTPPVLFLLLNLVIGTIAFTSGLRNGNGNGNGGSKDEVAELNRSNNFNVNDTSAGNESRLRQSSSFFSRLMSFRENKVASEKTEAEEERNAEEEGQDAKMEDEVVQRPGFEENVVYEVEEIEAKVEGKKSGKKQKRPSSCVGRSKSDTPPIADLKPVPLPSKLKKSGTFESAFSHYVVPPSDGIVEEDDGDAEVNAKADDFINKFKQQLKLQRLESIMKYKQRMISST
eukprot:TRINITY_DN35534_c0_g1_i1.p1 TRINITY_DN35534_c0_g1~~TRINITY_DN35534_c0_g1_i1.p1  ORF type:complete len:265 (+),score=37.01 TRINITY_DN35534_c0_g1_i1:64-858(+)